MQKRIEHVVTVAIAALAGCGGSTTDGVAGSSTSSSSGSSGGSSSGSSGTSGIVSSSSSGSPISPDGGSTIAPFPDDDTFACTDTHLAPGLHPGTPVDYIEVRGPQPFSTPVHDGGIGIAYESKSGTPCATAPNPDACKTALEKAAAPGWNPSAGCGPGLRQSQHLVFTRGAEVGVAGTEAEVVSLLAPIDSIEEARVVLLARSGIPLSCAPAPGKTGWRKNADGSFEIIATYGGCPGRRGRFKIAPTGVVTLVTEQNDGQQCVCGRRFEGLVSGAAGGAARGLGPYFAELAHLEAASVIAFRRFERELAVLGASEAFLARARAARADEVRHAASMARLARRFGGVVPAVEATPLHARSPIAFALENAVEGCVRETYGAMVAAYQARMARDPQIRAVMTVVAADEARHAELAHDVAAWLEPHLPRADRDAIAAAKVAAVRDLRDELAARAHADVRREAGVPDIAMARRLLEGLGELALPLAV